MDYNLKSHLSIILILTCIISCGENLKHKVKEKNSSVKAKTKILEGEFKTTQKLTKDIKDFSNKQLILMFADSFCIECTKKTRLIKSSFTNSRKPKNIYFLSLIVGEDLEEAHYWKKDNKVPWIVGEDEDLSIFKKYCPELKTPCTIISNPDYGIVFRKIGKVSIELIQSYVGEW